MQRQRLLALIRPLGHWADVIALALWGLLLLNYWLSGKLNLLIHPNYNILTVASAIGLLGLAAWKSWELWQRRKSVRTNDTQHISLLPPGWGSLILVAVAMLGFLVTPRAFASQTALQRGVADVSLPTQVRPQQFRGVAKSEERTLIEWVRTLQVYPEPDAYAGQKVKIQGFSVHSPNLPEQYFLLTRFVITCCAADAYPVSLPIKLNQGTRNNYKVDQWFEVEGEIITETLGEGKRQVVVQSSGIRPIYEPKNPYDY
jgi:uncharacterized repeat protein (TIGR03943 family)